MKSIGISVIDKDFISGNTVKTRTIHFIIRLDDGNGNPDIRSANVGVVEADDTAPVDIQYVDENGDIAYKTVILKVETHE